MNETVEKNTSISQNNTEGLERDRQKAEISKTVADLFAVMRRYKPGNGLTTAEKQTIIATVLADMPNAWNIEQALRRRFNL
jgi:hypothetical protein